MQKFCASFISLFLFVNCVHSHQGHDDVPWFWTCKNDDCVKTPAAETLNSPALNLESCKLFCSEHGLLWPKPTGTVDFGNFLSKVNVRNIEFDTKAGGMADDLLLLAAERFKHLMGLVVPEGEVAKTNGKKLIVHLINQNPDIIEFPIDTDESYTLSVSPSTASSGAMNATILANSFYGLRHGLETLSQLAVYDDERDHVLMVRDVYIEDKPAYPYRGFLLDTARNYFPISAIKRTIDAMAAVKLNTFHWHITDSHSFPLVTERGRDFSKTGAYSKRKVYTKQQIAELSRYALARGVRLVPELDAPAHVGEGWQDTGLTVCFKAEPWQTYCVEPPCGQLNPLKESLYDVLEDIYMDMAEAFQPEIFHMGGDEVSQKCWEVDPGIRKYIANHTTENPKSGFLELWNLFQIKAQEKAYKAFGKRIPLVLWTSTLTEFEHIDKYVHKDDYIIQVWTTGFDPQIRGLLSKGYKLIMSNYDALYMDCGFGAWVGEGNNWCSPYIGWQKVYMNKLSALGTEDTNHLILGGELALWSEQADGAVLDARVWPRAAAAAERWWSDPASDWSKAMQRFLNIRERLVRMGVQADTIQPEWCYQNEGKC